VIAPDVNLLVYATDQESRFHQGAKAWLEGVLSGTESIGFAWNVLLGFLRISTRAVRRPLTAEQALGLVGLWLAQPNVVTIEPGPRRFELLSGLLLSVGTAGNLTSDAHLAAVALEHGADVYSADADFRRFTGLRWHNPLAS
jgi:toxin-antitoxin system PIN domain toxin